MRPKLLLFVCVALLNVLFATCGAMADFDGLINIDDPAPNSQGSENSKRGSDGEGDDEDDYGSVMGDESGSGSGDEETTDPSIVDVSVVSPTTEESPATTEAETTTEIDNKITEEPTGDESEEVDEIDGESKDNMYGGGVGATKPSGNDPSKDKNSATDDPSKDKSPNAEARVDEKVLRVLTTEVIAAVVVGAVCAVILIAFLVYRLRKRDEGSYALSDAGYKDTYKLQGDTGKEAFV